MKDIREKIKDNLKAIEMLYNLGEFEAAALITIETIKFENSLK